MPQDDSFVLPSGIDFLIAEVKAGECRLNGPWAKPGPKNVQYVLRWMGFMEEGDRLEAVAQALYQQKKWQDPDGRYSVRIACFGKSISSAPGMQGVVQRTHLQSVQFIIDRFRRFDARKADHRQWDSFIKKLFTMADQGASAQQILRWVDSRG